MIGLLTSRRATALALLSFVLAPLLWLAPCVFGSRTFVPYDINQFPPASILSSDDELAAARDGANFDVTEPPIWFVPELELARDELRAGRLPTWNPFARGGAPLHAHGLIGLCYPPNWLALFADEPASKLALVAWCNLALAGLLAFGLFRQLRIGLPAAWFAATLFQLSAPIAANSFFWMRLASFIWLPGVLWAMLRVAQPERARLLPIVALGGAFAMTWLAGFPPFAATTTIFAGLLFVWLIGERLITHGRSHALRQAMRLFVGLALGACWALPQVLPSLAFFPHSARPPVPAWSDVAGSAFESYGLLGYLIPNAFGDPTTVATLPYGNSPMQLLWNTRLNQNGTPALPNYNFTEYSVFVSSFGIVLTLLGGLFARGRHAWFARSALLLALGLGLFVPGINWLYHLPVVQNVWPMRWPAAATLFVTWLAALGWQRIAGETKRISMAAGSVCIVTATLLWWRTAKPLQSHRSDQEWAIEALMEHYATSREAVVTHVQGDAAMDRLSIGFEHFAKHGAIAATWLTGIGVLLLAHALIKHARARQLTLVLAAIASIVQLAWHGIPITRGAHNLKGKDTPVHAFLREQAIAHANEGGFQIVRTATAPGQPNQLPPGQVMHPGVRDLNFYSHADAHTLQPVRMLLDRYEADLALGPDAGARIAGKGFLTQSLPAQLLQHPLFDLLGVRFALTTEPKLEGIVGPVVGPVVGGAIKGRGSLFVHERPNAMPRAYVAQGLVALTDDAAVLAAITDQTLQPRSQAYVVASELPDGITATTPSQSEARAITMTRDDATYIELDVAAGHARHLVMIDTFLPGWQATIDGAPAPVVRCNHSQRLLALPTTTCHVTLRYAAPGLMMGLTVMLFATLCTIAASLLYVRRRRRAQAPVQTQE